MENKLSEIFEKVDKCEENKCCIDKKNIEYMFKPDKGIKDKKLQKQLFPNELQPKLCDCIIQKDGLILLEIKCRRITISILKKIEKQLLNVGKILKEKNISFERVAFIYEKLDNNKMRQAMPTILGKRLEYFQFNNKAIII